MSKVEGAFAPLMELTVPAALHDFDGDLGTAHHVIRKLHFTARSLTKGLQQHVFIDRLDANIIFSSNTFASQEQRHKRGRAG